MIVLAIDQGTSGTKALVVDHDGTVAAAAEVPIRPDYLADGGVEQSPDELLASVLAAGRQAVQEAGRPVDAVALANQGETVLAWDPRSGEPLTAACVWQDRRSAELCLELEPERGWIEQRTGLALDPYFSAPKMAWLRRHRTRDGVVTTTDTWLLHRLTGAFVTDASTASRSLLLDVDRVDWDLELLSAFGLSGEPLPAVLSNDEVVGTTAAFGRPAPVAGIVVDQQAALLAQSGYEPGSAKSTFGTGAFLLANAGACAPRSSSGLTTSVAWRLREATTYCTDGQVYTAGSAVRWLRELGLIADARELDRVAAEDAGGVLCVPALAGLAAPWWRADARAALVGMTLSTGRGEVVRAVLEGIAAQVAELVSAVERDGAPLSRLRVDGGLTHSATLLQVLADLVQLPVEVYPSAHATAVGAAACARLALDPRCTVADAVPAWTPAARFIPRWTADRAAAFRERWRRTLAATTDDGAPGTEAGGTA
ncbi:FGGY family carbohydrate kinase [Nakamurella endophytica]|uniref:ATP:glycerol 3-phosphotransferase n=1 Tax=Nakamurella endophytica TaxID=1748367 RepID=A0A917T0U8_9ACTN|nr:FGGY family carbohydrate kinase [Nakamurella endophytica]GGM05011.1 carbohydrate kinase [Nakamurella endophytica]